MSIQTVGVIGAGQMGNGIAHTFAVAGYRVLLNDISEDALTAAMARIEKNTARQVSKGALSEDARAEALANIRTTQDLGALGGTDLVIEAATEREDIKNQIFAGLAPSLGENTILTTNTSSLSITRLAAKTDRPERFMGFHFMNRCPDAIGRADPRHRHLGRDLSNPFGRGEAFGKNRGQRRGLSGFHREPHPDPNDQRSLLCAL